MLKNTYLLLQEIQVWLSVPMLKASKPPVTLPKAPTPSSRLHKHVHPHDIHMLETNIQKYFKLKIKRHKTSS